MGKTNDLVEQNIGIAYTIASHLYKTNSSIIEYEDLSQICCLALLEASRKYEPDRNVKFSTYSYNVIKNNAISELNKIRKERNMCVILLEEGISDNSTEKEIEEIEQDCKIKKILYSLDYFEKDKEIILEILNRSLVFRHSNIP